MEDWQEEEVWAVTWGTKEPSRPPTPPSLRRRPAAAPRKLSLRSSSVVIRRLSGGEEAPDQDQHKKQEEDEEEEGSGMVPPHQWIARKTEKKEIASFSMCEGAGRTLKGRDLSRVRTAVLTRTGFLEPSSAR